MRSQVKTLASLRETEAVVIIVNDSHVLAPHRVLAVSPKFWRVPNQRPTKPRAEKRGQVAQVVERSPEKAGVGGSTPSLATMLSIPCKLLSWSLGHNWSQCNSLDG